MAVNIILSTTVTVPIQFVRNGNDTNIFVKYNEAVGVSLKEYDTALGAEVIRDLPVKSYLFTGNGELCFENGSALVWLQINLAVLGIINGCHKAAPTSPEGVFWKSVTRANPGDNGRASTLQARHVVLCIRDVPVSGTDSFTVQGDLLHGAEKNIYTLFKHHKSIDGLLNLATGKLDALGKKNNGQLFPVVKLKKGYFAFTNISSEAGETNWAAKGIGISSQMSYSDIILDLSSASNALVTSLNDISVGMFDEDPVSTRNAGNSLNPDVLTSISTGLLS